MQLYKHTKSAVDYTDHAMKRNEQCSLCKHYQIGKTCNIVRGEINPRGWCNKFNRIKA